MENNKEMKYDVDSITLTEEELRECIENKNHEAIIMAFSKVVNKYTSGYVEDIKQEIYIKMIDVWIKKTDINNWKNYLYSRIHKYAKDLIKYNYKFINLSKREADRLVKLYHKKQRSEMLTDDEYKEMQILESKWQSHFPIQHYENNEIDITGNSYEMGNFDHELIDEIKSLLSDKEFDIFYMNTVMEYPTRYIAEKYKISQPTVVNIIQKCKNILKNSENIKKFMI